MHTVLTFMYLSHISALQLILCFNTNYQQEEKGGEIGQEAILSESRTIIWELELPSVDRKKMRRLTPKQ